MAKPAKLAAVHGISKSQRQLSDWTTTKANEEGSKEEIKEEFTFPEACGRNANKMHPEFSFNFRTFPIWFAYFIGKPTRFLYSVTIHCLM